MEGREVLLLRNCFDDPDEMIRLEAKLDQAGIAEFSTIALVSSDQVIAEVAVPESEFVKRDGTLIGCGFALNGYGANLPDLFHIPDRA